MRDIKFRAWDKKEEVIIHSCDIPFEINWNLQEFCEVFLNGISDRYIPMQYTGLKDKNGVEIYEGDIVKIYTESTPEEAEDEKEIMEIKWDKQGGYLSSVSCGYEFDPLIGNDCILMEVIGNIYENKELLDVGE